MSFAKKSKQTQKSMSLKILIKRFRLMLVLRNWTYQNNTTVKIEDIRRAAIVLILASNTMLLINVTLQTQPFLMSLIIKIEKRCSGDITFSFSIHCQQRGTKSQLKKQSHLKSQFPPEITLLKSQQNFQTCLKSNFLFTPILNIYFKRFSR